MIHSFLNCRAQATLSLSAGCSLTTIHSVCGKCTHSSLHLFCPHTPIAALLGDCDPQCGCQVLTLRQRTSPLQWDSLRSQSAMHIKKQAASKQQRALKKSKRASAPKGGKSRRLTCKYTYAHTNALMHSVSVGMCVCVRCCKCVHVITCHFLLLLAGDKVHLPFVVYLNTALTHPFALSLSLSGTAVRNA